MSKSEYILQVENLQTYFPVKKGRQHGFVRAVDGVSFKVRHGETVGLVGESGCGKSTIGRTIMRFNNPTGGKMLFDGDDITSCDMGPYRKRMQMVFQDPYSSLNPRMSIGEIVGEPLDIQFPKMNPKERQERILEQIQLVGLNSEHLSRFPHEFSGGQRQRISIARSMVIKPEFMVLDEPVSALDVSIQAQIINMLMDLQQQMGLAYLFIAHDLAVVRHISQQVVVMYLGHVMEINESEDLYKRPLHPYTKALLSAIPVPDPNTSRTRRREILQGDVPSPINPPKGCVFSTRCRYATEECRSVLPKVEEVTPGHLVACHHYKEIN
ncbi:MAG: ABC transporter ATP-binding protein [Candidatus Faecivicinus sp.]